MPFGVLALIAFAALADDVAAVAAPPQPAISAPAAPVAASDTPVVIEIAEPLSTRINKPGDMFAISLAEPIVVDGDVIIPAGARGQGQVVDSGRAGFGGRPAKLVLAARYVEWNGRRASLRAFRWAQSGADRQTAAGLLLAVPYAGMASIFIRGGEIEVPAGVRAQAKLSQSVSRDAPQPSADAAPDPSLPPALNPPSK